MSICASPTRIIANKAALHILPLVLVLVFAPFARAASPWRLYPKITVVRGIAVGEANVWFATDGGLLVLTKRTQRWQHIDADNGLPNVEVEAVATDRKVSGSAWFVLKPWSLAPPLLCRYSLRDRRLETYPFPAPPPKHILAGCKLVVNSQEIRVDAAYQQINGMARNQVRLLFERDAKTWRQENHPLQIPSASLPDSDLSEQLKERVHRRTARRSPTGSHRLAAWLENLELQAVTLDGSTLWLGGKFRIARYNTRTGRLHRFSRLPDEVSTEAIPVVERKHGDLIAQAGDSDIYHYVPARDAWKVVPFHGEKSQRREWIKIRLPATPRPQDRAVSMWGALAAENAEGRYVVFGGGTFNRVSEFPRAFTQAPGRIDRKTGKVRCFTETWGYYVGTIVPVGADAWLIGEDIREQPYPAPDPNQRVLFYYHAATDTVRRYEHAGFRAATSTPMLVATPNGALFCFQRQYPPVHPEPLLAYDPVSDRWNDVTLPAGWIPQEIYAEGSLFLVHLSHPNPTNTDYDFQAVTAENHSLQKLNIPAAYAALDLYTLCIDRSYVWFGGRGIVRARIHSLLRR